MVMLSNGASIQSPMPLKKQLRKLKRYQRVMSKKVRSAKKDGRKLAESNNFQKQKVKVAKLHYKISNTRKDTLHKTTTYLANNFFQIAIEDLNVKGMLKNHKLARSIADIGFYEFKRQLEYKSKMKGNNLIVADRFFPSSKTCSECKSIKSKDELTLKDRTYKCKCGYEQDRDLNAAINLENLIHINEKVRPVRSKLKPVEIAAIREVVFPLQVTSIVESGSKLQAG
jgi:putative transposase